MSQMVHVAIAGILFFLTWQFILKKVWPMAEKIKEIVDDL
jgi:hypothetical protein